MTLGQRLRTRREELGLTQRDLAEKLLTTEQLISLWELDRRSPSAKKLAVLSDVLGTTTDHLIKGREVETVCDLGLAIRSDKNLSPDAKEALLKVAAVLKGK